MRRNKEYSKEFKKSTIQLAMNSEEPMKKIAQDLDVNYNTLSGWVRDYKIENNLIGEEENPKKKDRTKESLEEENKRLIRENRLLKEERDILKKATAPQGHFFQGTYFAKETL